MIAAFPEALHDVSDLVLRERLEVKSVIYTIEGDVKIVC